MFGAPKINTLKPNLWLIRPVSLRWNLNGKIGWMAGYELYGFLLVSFLHSMQSILIEVCSWGNVTSNLVVLLFFFLLLILFHSFQAVEWNTFIIFFFCNIESYSWFLHDRDTNKIFPINQKKNWSFFFSFFKSFNCICMYKRYRISESTEKKNI